MSRQPRICIPGIPQHVIQRGNNRQTCFASDDDFAAYAHWLNKSAKKYQVAVHAWVFMTNHAHLLMTPSSEDGISKVMQALGRQYVRYFNHAQRRSGTLWEGRFKSCVVDVESYLLVCMRYIELNPVRANMVRHPEDYKWSSFISNGKGKETALWTPHPIYVSLGDSVEERAMNYRELFKGHLKDEQLSQIRKATNRGIVLGNDRFKKKIELQAQAGSRVETRKFT